MNGKQRQQAVGREQNEPELLRVNPYSLEGRTHCGCRLHTGTLQPQWVTSTPWAPWKTFLVCLLACLIAVTLVVLVLYFVSFGKLVSNTTVIIQTDGKHSHVNCSSGSTPLPASQSPPGLNSTTLTTQSSSSLTPTPAMETTEATTHDHEVIIEFD